MATKMKWCMAGIAVAMALPMVASAGENSRNFHAVNRLRVEYDDNIYQTGTDEEESWKFIEQIDLIYNLNLDQTFLSLRYQPSFIYWTDRDDDTDLHHAFDGVLNHAFSPRTTLSLKDTFRLAEQTEQISTGNVAQERGDYIYNTFNAALSYLSSEQTRWELAGRITTLDYDEDIASQTSDYDIYVGGLTLRHDWKPATAVLGEARYEVLEYSNEDRNSDTIYAGAGVEHTFSPRLLGNLRGGIQARDFENAVSDSNETPYIDASVTWLPSGATRVTSGLSYGQFETDVAPFASQERSKIFVSLAHDITARISGYLTGAYTNGEYDKEETPSANVVDGDEQRVQASARASYEINMDNHLELSYQYSKLDSDVRRDYHRNRIGLGWVLKL